MPVWLTKEVIIYGAIALFLFGGGYELRVKLDEADQAKTLAAQLVAQQEAQKAQDDKAAKWEIQLAALRDDKSKLERRLKHETAKAAYSKCIVPDDGVRLYNAALSGAYSSGQSPDSLP